MALNVVRAGYPVTVFDKDAAKAAALLEHGGVGAASAAAAVADAEVVMTSLPGPVEIQQLAFSEGLLDAMRVGAVWIDLSTSQLEVQRKVLQAAAQKTIHILDAPVTGGIEGAHTGQLVMMVGGQRWVFEKYAKLLQAIASKVMYLGAHGTGYVAKIAQVVLCYLHSVALSEALMLAVKGGVSAQVMLDIIQSSTGRSYVADRYGPAILDGSYDPGFTLGLAHKDLQLTLQLAESVAVKLPMCEQVEALYASAVAEYGAEQNHLTAVKLLEQEHNTPLRG